MTLFHTRLSRSILISARWNQTNPPGHTVNQRFESLFPRENGLFASTMPVHFLTPEDSSSFSRRIVNPEYGARLTGRQGHWLAGLLAIDDRAPGQQLAPGDPDTGKHAVIGIARVQREFQNHSTLGLLVTNYNFAGNNEQVLSLDTRLRFGSHLVFTGQAKSQEARPAYTDGTHPQGTIFHAETNYSSLHLTAKSLFRSLGPGFTSTLSYIPRVDIRQGVHNIALKWLPSRAVLKSLDLPSMSPKTGTIPAPCRIGSSRLALHLELTGNTTITVQRTEALEVL